MIAIDGPTAAGKSTVGREVARRLGLDYVDTGAMYRSVAWAALQRKVDLGDAAALERLAAALRIETIFDASGHRILVDGQDVTQAIRSPQVSEAASAVSAVPGVRTTLVALQRQRAAAGGVVMEGRDIGTVVLPDADVKVFLQASLDTRARRRHAELRARGVQATLEEVRRQEAARDHRDQTRAHSPLRAAADAVVIDTTARRPEEVAEVIVRMVRERSGAR